MDTDKDEAVTFDEFYAKLSEIDYGKYAWMTEDEAHLYMFDVYNTDADDTLTFAEAKAGYELENERKIPVSAIWSHVNPNWDW